MRTKLPPHCYKCKSQENLILVCKSGTKICCACQKIKMALYNKSSIGKLKHKEWAKKDKLINPEKWRAKRKRGVDKFRNSPQGKEYFKKRYESLRVNSPEKIKAHNALNYAVLHNEIQKPDCCSVCLKKTEKRNLIGHHEDYSKPLVVVWVCRLCHYNKHHEIKSI